MQEKTIGHQTEEVQIFNVPKKTFKKSVGQSGPVEIKEAVALGKMG